MSEPSSVKELLASSGLAFTGTVEMIGATTGTIDADDRTVIVNVDEMLNGPPDVSLPTGLRVTVRLNPNLVRLDVGARAAFFVNGVAYGASLITEEVGRADPQEVTRRAIGLSGEGTALSPISLALAELAQDELVEHARSANAIVRGQVTALGASSRSAGPSEHDPQYWIATLAVDLVEKGSIPPPLTVVAVLYANSIDVMWRESPKPKAGQAGLWLLHTSGEKEAPFAPFQLLHSIDMQPSIQLNLLRARGT